MSDSFYAFYNIKIKPSLSELAFSGFVSKSSESWLECFVTNLDRASTQGWGQQGPGEHHYFKIGNIVIKFSKCRINLNHVVRLTFILEKKKCTLVGFCNGKAKKDVFLQWDVQNNQEANGST